MMLKLDYTKLAESAKTLETQGNTFEDCIKTMTKVVNNLPTIWEAKTCDEYVAQYNSAKKTLNDVRKLIADMSTQMKKISKNFSDADESMAKQMK